MPRSDYDAAERNRADRLARLVSGTVLAILLAGCSAPSFIGRPYDNFTAYYNGFYNAEKVFEDGYESIDLGDQPVDRRQFLPLFVKPAGSSGTAHFQDAIGKSADLLREHPESKWVDDALLMIGRSYFYQGQFVAAQEKFQEVIGMDSSLEPEARFWLVRTLVTNGAVEEAAEQLVLALAQQDIDDRWEPMYRLAMAELHVNEKSWEEAAGELEMGLESVRDKELAARAQFLLGQVYETQGRFDEAAEAYRSVLDYRPWYELEYAAQYSAIRVEGINGDAGQALSDVRRMERDDKHYEYQPNITFLRARILQRMGQIQEAGFLYDELLYNTGSGSMSGIPPELEARIMLALAELHRDVYGNYVVASSYLDSVNVQALAPPTSGTVGFGAGRSATLAAPEAVEGLDELQTSFAEFARNWSQLVRYDSLLTLGEMPQEEFDARIQEMQLAKAEEYAEQLRQQRERERNQQFQNQTTGIDRSNSGLPPGKVINSGVDASAAGFLRYRDAARVQEGALAFRQTWGDRPLVPNWRRQSAIMSSSRVSQTADGSEDELPDMDLEGGELPPIDISAIPRDSTAQAVMRKERARIHYDLGNTLYLTMNQPDSAAVWYRQVIEDNEDSLLVQRAYYALGEVQRELGDARAAEQLFQDALQSSPDSDFAGEVRARLGAQDQNVNSDSLLAFSEYERVFRRWQDVDDHDALNNFIKLAARWPESEVSAKSLLAAADIHLERAQADTSAILAPVPVTIETDYLRRLWPDLYPETVLDSTGVRTAVDSLATADFVAAPADSLVMADLPAAPPDSTLDDVDQGAPPDSLTSDVLPTPSDSTSFETRELVPGDSLNAENELDSRSDSTVVVKDANAVEPAITLEINPQEGDDQIEAVKQLLVPLYGFLAIDSLSRSPLRVEHLYERVIEKFPGTRYDSSASRILPLIEGMRKLLEPTVPDSLGSRMDSVLAQTDSLDLQGDSLVADSNVAKGDSLFADSNVAKDDSLFADSNVAKDDSLVADSNDIPKKGLWAKPNPAEDAIADTSLAPQDSVLLVPEGDSNIPVKVHRPVPQNRVSDQAAATDSVIVKLPESDLPDYNAPSAHWKLHQDRGWLPTAGRVETSDQLRPLLPTGRPNLTATGWTLIVAGGEDEATNRTLYEEAARTFAETGFDVHFVTEIDQENRSRFHVGLGLFEDQAAAEEAANRTARILPIGFFFLNMVAELE